MPVYFYDTKEKPYGCFTNFSRHGFELDGDWWITSEHYFQAQKFAGTPHAEEIRKLPTPREAFDLARKLKHLVRSDWFQIRDDVMRKAVERKFEFNADIRAVLLSTGDALLVEDSPTDSYWGCGADRKGKNMLGKILMEVREKFRTAHLNIPTTITNQNNFPGVEFFTPDKYELIGDRSGQPLWLVGRERGFQTPVVVASSDPFKLPTTAIYLYELFKFSPMEVNLTKDPEMPIDPELLRHLNS